MRGGGTGKSVPGAKGEKKRGADSGRKNGVG